MNDGKDKQTAMTHLKEHIKYPATSEELKGACNNLSDISKEMKDEFLMKLPEGTYNSPEEVMEAVGWTP
jgi:hypothetical protein